MVLCPPKVAHKETVVPPYEARSSRQKNIVVQDITAPFLHFSLQLEGVSSLEEPEHQTVRCFVKEIIHTAISSQTFDDQRHVDSLHISGERFQRLYAARYERVPCISRRRSGRGDVRVCHAGCGLQRVLRGGLG